MEVIGIIQRAASTAEQKVEIEDLHAWCKWIPLGTEFRASCTVMHKGLRHIPCRVDVKKVGEKWKLDTSYETTFDGEKYISSIKNFFTNCPYGEVQTRQEETLVETEQLQDVLKWAFEQLKNIEIELVGHFPYEYINRAWLP